VGSLSWPSLVRLGLAVWERLSKTGRQPMVDARAKAVRAAMAAVARRGTECFKETEASSKHRMLVACS